MAKTRSRVPDAPSIQGADSRSYLNPRFFGFPDEGGRCEAILEKMLEIKARAQAFQREKAAKQQKIRELKNKGHAAAVEAYIEGSSEFASLSEVQALEVDIEELDIRINAARQATERLGGEFALLQEENRESWLEVLRAQERALMDRYQTALQEVQVVKEAWRSHATMVESISGERVYLDYVDPGKPILLKDGDDLRAGVIGTWSAGSIT